MPLRRLLKLFLVQSFSLVVLSQAISAQPYVTETLVGLGTAVSGPAISAELPSITSLTSDRSGNIYASWSGVVVKIDASGHLARVFVNGPLAAQSDAAVDQRQSARKFAGRRCSRRCRILGAIIAT